MVQLLHSIKSEMHFDKPFEKACAENLFPRVPSRLSAIKQLKGKCEGKGRGHPFHFTL